MLINGVLRVDCCILITRLYCDTNFFQMRPSQYMFQMSMNTEQKLANMHTMNLPRKIQLLDMEDTTHQKVFFNYLILSHQLIEIDCI